MISIFDILFNMLEKFIIFIFVLMIDALLAIIDSVHFNLVGLCQIY